MAGPYAGGSPNCGQCWAGARRYPEIAAALEWAERASLPAAELEDTATVRLALAACAKTLTGKAAAGSTQRRKRSVFYNALGYAVEQGHLAAICGLLAAGMASQSAKPPDAELPGLLMRAGGGLGDPV
jgi:hypothetical protein